MSRAMITRSVTPSVWQMILQIAPTMYQARMFGVASPEAAAAVMLKGYELGLGLAASFEFIQMVEGKPTLSPRGALALVLNSGLLETLKIDEQPDRCTVAMKRRDGPDYSFTWSMDDAKRAGVVKDRGAWMTYPSLMLKWRATGYVIDVLFSDVTGGLKRADEFGADLDEHGEVDDGDQPSPPPTRAAAAALPAASTATLDDLVQQFGAEAVIVAAEGKIPATTEEVVLVAEKLAKDG